VVGAISMIITRITGLAGAITMIITRLIKLVGAITQMVQIHCSSMD